MTNSLKNRCISFFLIIILIFAALPTSAAEAEPNVLEIDANNAMIFNADNGYELYSRNADNLVYCAFLPRLMTCILLVESGLNLEAEITITTEMLKNTPEKSSINMAAGHTISLRDLMKAFWSATLRNAPWLSL